MPTATIEFDIVTGGLYTASPAQFNHTISPDRNMMLCVDVVSECPYWSHVAPSITAMTYAGVAMTLVTALTLNHSGDNVLGRLECWYLQSPKPGSNQLSVTCAETDDLEMYIAAQSYKNINQADPIGSYAVDTIHWEGSSNAVTAPGMSAGYWAKGAAGVWRPGNVDNNMTTGTERFDLDAADLGAAYGDRADNGYMGWSRTNNCWGGAIGYRLNPAPLTPLNQVFWII